MYGIRAGLRNRIHDAARGPAILRRVARRDHLELLNRRLRHRDNAARTLAAANAAKERLIVVRAIQHDVGVDAPLPRERDLAARLAIHLRGGRQKRKVLKTPSVDRQVGERRGIHRRRQSRGFEINQRLTDIHRSGHRLHGNRHIHGRRGAHRQHQARHLGRRKSRGFHRQLIGARIEEDGAVKAALIRLQLAQQTCARIANLYIGADDDRLIGVNYGAGDLRLIPVGLRPHRGHSAQAKRQHTESVGHKFTPEVLIRVDPTETASRGGRYLYSTMPKSIQGVSIR